MKRFILPGIVLVLISLSVALFMRPEKTDMRLYYGIATEIETRDCSAVEAVIRRVPADDATLDYSIRLLLTGPTKSERKRGLASTYLGIPTSPNLQPLLAYYRGVTVSQDGVVTLDFSREALLYLNAPACLQAATKAPIEATLRQYDQVTDVQYSIDGTVFTEWDA